MELKQALTNEQLAELRRELSDISGIPAEWETPADAAFELNVISLIDEVVIARRVLAGLPDGCIEGGWTAVGANAYAASLEREIQARELSIKRLKDDLSALIGLLRNNEWAEHCTITAPGRELEQEITRLVNGQAGAV